MKCNKWDDAKKEKQYCYLYTNTMLERFWLYYDMFVVQLIGVCLLELLQHPVNSQRQRNRFGGSWRERETSFISLGKEL